MNVEMNITVDNRIEIDITETFCVGCNKMKLVQDFSF